MIEDREELGNLFSYIMSFDNEKFNVAIDLAHNVVLLGALLSKKPENILEVGVGSGYATKTLISGIKYNKVGELTCVDNFHDWGGDEQPFAKELREEGITFIESSEERFVTMCDDNTYDFILSDADHRLCGLLINEYLRIAKHNAFIFIHDTKLAGHNNMALIHDRLEELNMPNYTFCKATRRDEDCDVGFTFIINKKGEQH